MYDNKALLTSPWFAKWQTPKSKRFRQHRTSSSPTLLFSESHEPQHAYPQQVTRCAPAINSRCTKNMVAKDYWARLGRAFVVRIVLIDIPPVNASNHRINGAQLWHRHRPHRATLTQSRKLHTSCLAMKNEVRYSFTTRGWVHPVLLASRRSTGTRAGGGVRERLFRKELTDTISKSLGA
jgi:hypothetical protein